MLTKHRLVVLAFAALALSYMATPSWAVDAGGCAKMTDASLCKLICPTGCPKDCVPCPNPGSCSGPCLKACTKASIGTSAQAGSTLGLTVHESLSRFAGQNLAIVK